MQDHQHCCYLRLISLTSRFTHLFACHLPYTHICILLNQISLSSGDFLLCRASGRHSVQCKYPLTCDSRLSIFSAPHSKQPGEKTSHFTHRPVRKIDWIFCCLNIRYGSPATRSRNPDRRGQHWTKVDPSILAITQVSLLLKSDRDESSAAANCAGGNDIVLYEKRCSTTGGDVVFITRCNGAAASRPHSLHPSSRSI